MAQIAGLENVQMAGHKLFCVPLTVLIVKAHISSNLCFGHLCIYLFI